MGVKIKDYILEINRQKQEALDNNETYLVIRAGDLHSKCGTKGSPTLIQCCSAMKQCMLIGDEITYNKENKSGVSADLTIQYNVEHMEERENVHIVKKRGRPAGSKNSVKEVTPASKTSISPKTSTHHEKSLNTTVPEIPTLNTNDPNSCVEYWMKTERIKYEALDEMYLIKDPYGLWAIPKYRNESASDRFLCSIKMITEEHYKCSIIFKESRDAHRFWESMSEEVIERLNLSALFIAKDGSVSQEI